MEEWLTAADKKFTGGERRAEGEMRLPRTGNLLALKQETNGYAAQGLLRKN